MLDISEKWEVVRVPVALHAETDEVAELGEIWAELYPLFGIVHSLTLILNDSVDAVKQSYKEDCF